MPEKIFVAVAWPYANGSLHMGQIAGAYLAPDIFARYHRAAGNRVLMVSGSDQHGTPITVRAEQENTTPEAIVARFHPEFLECWRRLGITFDLYTTTGTKNHEAVVHDMFLRLLENGHISKQTTLQFFDPEAGRFLPDRYVEGTCPRCGFDGARGDQCDNCGSTLDPTDLINPRSRFTGATPVLRETEHFFFRLSQFQEPMRRWLTTDKEHWRKHVLNYSLGVVREGLRDRSITRDMEWGVRLPVEDLGEGKRIYVWFEALMGYVSAAKEWAQIQGTPEAWRDFWEDENCKTYYFIGKDNMIFHTIIWPAWLMAYGGLNLPFDVPANQYVNIKGAKASTSRGTAPFLPDYLDRYDSDAIRYYLTSIMPENADSDFSEADLIRRNNEELVSTWGNLANRVLNLTYRNFEGRVPASGSLEDTDRALLKQAETTVQSVGEAVAACHFRDGLQTAMLFARDTNRYLDQSAPWKAMASDRAAAGRALYTALGAIEALKMALYPYLPFSAQRLHEMLGHAGRVDEQPWRAEQPVAGGQLGQPSPLFKKLDPLEQDGEASR